VSHATDTDTHTTQGQSHGDPVWLLVVAGCVAAGAVGSSIHHAGQQQHAVESEPVTAPRDDPPPPVAIRDYYVDEELKPAGKVPEASPEAPAARTPEADPSESAAAALEQELLTAAKDPSVLARGRQVFKERCQPCHGPQGQGNLGPNLCDEYWIYGYSPVDVHTSIDVGKPKTGMIAWNEVLPPEDIKAVAAFVISLRGSNPPLPRYPEGKKRPD
jgi:mono/diheme cytochrome c family protein